MKKLYYLLLAITISLIGCAYQMTMMPRDSGKVYTGSVKSNGMGQGTLSIQLEDKTCSGNFVKTTSSDTFGFYQMYGNKGSVVTGQSQSFGGGSAFKGLLSCTDGTGMRCDVVGSSSGGGICVDSKNRVYDMIYQ